MWSTHFQFEVDQIEGENIEGPRVIVQHKDGTTRELPRSWVKLVSKEPSKKSEM